MTNQLCRHAIISGHVQGVFYRSNSEQKAQELSLTGWVRNISGSQVEILMCGSEENLSKMEKWLWEGPAACTVSNVEIKDHAFESHSDFMIKH